MVWFELLPPGDFLTDDALLTAHQTSNLVALCVQQNQIGIALLDLSAGIFEVQQQDFKIEQLAIELSLVRCLVKLLLMKTS